MKRQVLKMEADMDRRMRFGQALFVMVLLMVGSNHTLRADPACGQEVTGGDSWCVNANVHSWCYLEESCGTYCDCFNAALSECGASGSCDGGGGSSCSTDDCFATEDCCDNMGCVGGTCESPY